jgi:hypothetical protein
MTDASHRCLHDTRITLAGIQGEADATMDAFLDMRHLGAIRNAARFRRGVPFDPQHGAAAALPILRETRP